MTRVPVVLGEEAKVGQSCEVGAAPLVLFYNGIGAAWAKTSGSPSISLMALSAFLRCYGYRAQLLTDEMQDGELDRLLQEAKVVGFSVLTGNGINSALQLSRRIRRLSPSMPMVWGGYHATLEPEQTLQHELVDFVVRGEGELTLLELLRALDVGADRTRLERIAGLSFKTGGKSLHNPDRPASDLDSFPLPDYDLYRDVFLRQGELPYVSSRGCPFSCRFCCNAAFNRNHGLRFRQLSMERVIDQLVTLCTEFKPRSILFWDDLFLSTTKRIQDFVDGYDAQSFSFAWSAFGRCDVLSRVDDELLTGLKQRGLRKVFLGVESGSERMLRYLDKRLTIDEVLAAARKLARVGIDADFSFVNGFPGETREDVNASLDLRTQLKSLIPGASIRFFVYTPLPGAEVVEDCKRAGYVPPSALEGWKDFEFHAYGSPWIGREHSRWIRNISYASLFDGFAPDKCASVRDWLWLWISRTSSYRLLHKRLSNAPELELVHWMHRRRLGRSGL